MIISKIIGSGSCLPDRVIPNSHFDYLVENADEWIFSRTGIRERRFAHADQATSDLATVAAKNALESAGCYSNSDTSRMSNGLIPPRSRGYESVSDQMWSAHRYDPAV